MPVFKPCLTLLCLLCLCARPMFSQSFCPFPGQSAHSAIPICGTSVFSQSAAQQCQGVFSSMPPCPTTSPYRDYNAFWYKFTCYQGGTLGFMIKPNAAMDDYDWAIFDITGHQPDDVYIQPGLAVAFNWTNTRGNTGTTATATDMFTCFSQFAPAFGQMPTIVQGHEYLIMVCNFNQTGFGYDLEFTGGTAVITDALQPALFNSWYDELTNTVGIRLNKKLLCSSIAADGSEFTITPGNIIISMAEGINCGMQIDGDSILLQLSQPLPPGVYTVTINNGTDGNTLLDACQRQVPPGDVITFTVSNLQLSSTQANAGCNGGNDGSAAVTGVNGVPPYSYSWNTTPVQTGATISGLSAGTYTCTVTDAAHASRQIQVTITEPAPLPMVIAGADIVVSDVNTVTLNAQPYPSGNGLWDQLSGPSVAAIQDPATAVTGAGNLQEGVYLFRWTIGDPGCSNADTVKVTILVTPPACKFIVPNAFNPNSPGTNHLFKPKRHCAVGQYTFSVYNRWGEMVFRTTNPVAGWNGHYKGFAQPGGVYAWMITYTDTAGKAQLYKGTVMLVR